MGTEVSELPECRGVEYDIEERHADPEWYPSRYTLTIAGHEMVSSATEISMKLSLGVPTSSEFNAHKYLKNQARTYINGVNETNEI